MLLSTSLQHFLALLLFNELFINDDTNKVGQSSLSFLFHLSSEMPPERAPSFPLFLLKTRMYARF